MLKDILLVLLYSIHFLTEPNWACPKIALSLTPWQGNSDVTKHDVLFHGLAATRFTAMRLRFARRCDVAEDLCVVTDCPIYSTWSRILSRIFIGATFLPQRRYVRMSNFASQRWH